MTFRTHSPLIHERPLVRRISNTNRRAAVLIATITCLALASILLSSWVVTLLNNSRQLRLQHRQMQATIMADAALQRAARQLAADPKYSGEDWQLPNAACRQLGESVIEPKITIRIADAKDFGKRRVTAEVRFPTVADHTGIAIREQFFQIAGEGKANN